MKEKLNFGSFNMLLQDKTILFYRPLFTYSQSSFSKGNIHEREINQSSKIITQTISSTLSLNTLVSLSSVNHYKTCKNMLQYKFAGNEETNEIDQTNELPMEHHNKTFQKNFFRSKRNEVIFDQLKSMRMKINCSFQKFIIMNEYVQSLKNYTIFPEVKSPNDILIIERTETIKTMKEAKEPKFIFYQKRYRSPFPESDILDPYFKRRFAVDNPKPKKSNVKKQIFYTPHRIDQKKIDQYNKNKREQGISVITCTYGEFLVSNLNIDIPLRFSDLLTTKNINILDFEISYDPVMTQGIDNEINSIFQNVIFMPHFSFRKFAQNQFNNSSYFLKYFRYIPYHLSKHQKRKFTEIIEPILYSIMFDNLNAVLSGDYMRCRITNENSRHRKNKMIKSHHHRHFYQKRINQTYYNYSKIGSHHVNKYNNYTMQNNVKYIKDNKNSTLVEKNISDDYLSNTETDPSSLEYTSLSNMNKLPRVIFCDESQISSDDNEFLIENY